MAWDETRDAQLRTLWGEGHSGNEIARRMATTKNAIVGRAHRLALPSRPSPLPAQDELWTPEEDARMRDLRAAGFMCSEIGQRMGRTEHAVRHRCKRLGILAPARPRNDGVRPLVARGAAVVARARAASPLFAAPSPQASSMDGAATAVVAPPPPRPLVVHDRGCRWPLWADNERPTHLYCGEAQALRADGVRLAYCPCHAARAFTREHVRDPSHKVTRSTFAWGGVAA
jgi:GcrA cell cycle regulator